MSKQPTANTLWSNCTSTAWSPSTQKQQDFSVSVNTHKNIFPVTNSFTNPSGLSGQWYVVSAQPQAVPNLLQGYHMEALSITADTLGLLPYKLVNHSTTNPSVRHSSEKRQMTIYTVLNKIFLLKMKEQQRCSSGILLAALIISIPETRIQS